MASQFLKDEQRRHEFKFVGIAHVAVGKGCYRSLFLWPCQTRQVKHAKSQKADALKPGLRKESTLYKSLVSPLNLSSESLSLSLFSSGKGTREGMLAEPWALSTLVSHSLPPLLTREGSDNRPSGKVLRGLRSQSDPQIRHLLNTLAV